jgi:hypothetical protein
VAFCLLDFKNKLVLRSKCIYKHYSQDFTLTSNFQVDHRQKMNITKQLRHLSTTLRAANLYKVKICSVLISTFYFQIPIFTQARSESTKTLEELVAENAKYKKQIDELKTRNVELISKNLGCMSQIDELKTKNANVEGRITDILSKGNAMSSAYLSERVR